MDVKNKAVVITGGSSGLGRELAIALAKAGAKVMISSRDKDELEKAAAEIGAILFVADITKEDEVKSLADQAVTKLGAIDLWINNAGIWMAHAPIEEIDWKRVHDLIEVNLFGTVYGSKYALIQMRKQGAGAIVNILSTSALEGHAGSSGYCASKYAAMGFTKALENEAAPMVKVMAVYPDRMRTHLFDEKKPDDYASYMEPSYVAEKIIANIELENPAEELVIRRS